MGLSWQFQFWLAERSGGKCAPLYRAQAFFEWFVCRTFPSASLAGIRSLVSPLCRSGMQFVACAWQLVPALGILQSIQSSAIRPSSWRETHATLRLPPSC